MKELGREKGRRGEGKVGEGMGGTGQGEREVKKRISRFIVLSA